MSTKHSSARNSSYFTINTYRPRKEGKILEVGVKDFNWNAYANGIDIDKSLVEYYYSIYEGNLPAKNIIINKELTEGNIMVIDSMKALSKDPQNSDDRRMVVRTVSGYSFVIDLDEYKNSLMSYLFPEEEIDETILDKFYLYADTIFAEDLREARVPVYINQNGNPDIKKGILLANRDKLVSQTKLDTRDKTIYKAVVVGVNSGGFNCEINGTSVFLPLSHSGIFIPKEIAKNNNIIDVLKEYIGRVFDVVVYMNNAQKDLVVSAREYQNFILRKARENIKPNDMDKYEGKITGIVKYGIFLECEDKSQVLPNGKYIRFTGLLHVNGMSNKLFQAFNEGILYEGNIIEVYVNRLNENGSFVLSDLTSEQLANDLAVRIKEEDKEETSK